MKKITVAIAGLGSRGRDTYGRLALTETEIEVTALADPDEARLKEGMETFGVPAEYGFKNAADLAAQERLADIMFICTPDGDHYKTALAALRKGYHLLLEKPVAVNEEECAEIARVAKENGRHVVVCHVLRYSPFYGKVKEIIDSGKIGDVMTINAIEGVGYYHQAHSFVRGNWADTKASSPMILQKCCHDMDILLWLMGKKIKSISSYGSLHYFKPENAPEGSAERCLGGCKAKTECIYDAEKIYITNEKTGVLHKNSGWPVEVLAKPATEETIRKALETGPYGRCVFRAGNDAVDHQVVNMEFEDGKTAHLTMTAFTPQVYRSIQVMGTHGMIEGDMRTNLVTTTVFGKTPHIDDIAAAGEGLGGHGGGDKRMFDALMNLMTGKAGESLTPIDISVESHLASFAAERSRLNGGTPEVLKW